MKRLTIFLKDIGKVTIDGKKKLINTVSHIVFSDEEAQSKLAEYNEDKVNKYQLSNIK
jgi:hypothetical protein